MTLRAPMSKCAAVSMIRTLPDEFPFLTSELSLRKCHVNVDEIHTYMRHYVIRILFAWPKTIKYHNMRQGMKTRRSGSKGGLHVQITQTSETTTTHIHKLMEHCETMGHQEFLQSLDRLLEKFV